MILRILIIMLALGSSFTSTLFAGNARGDRLIREAGGAAGIPGIAGPPGSPGIAGAAGAAGTPGIAGIPGAPGILDFSDFYALMPTDNPAATFVSAGSAVEFPRDGSSNGVITRVNDTMFNLPTVGTYLVEFQVSVTSNAQLMLRLNGNLIPDSVVGRATGTTQLVGISLVTTTTPDSVLEVIYPPGNAPPSLIVTPLAGGTHPVSAHLVIIRIQ